MTGRTDFSVAAADHDDDPALLEEAVAEYLEKAYAEKSEQLGRPVMRMLESQVMLRIIDTRWMAHLQEMDYLKAGIGLRAFGQRDPLVEYKKRGVRRLREPHVVHVRGLPAHASAACRWP